MHADLLRSEDVPEHIFAHKNRFFWPGPDPLEPIVEETPVRFSQAKVCAKKKAINLCVQAPEPL